MLSSGENGVRVMTLKPWEARGDHLLHDPENSIMVIQAPLPLQYVNTY